MIWEVHGHPEWRMLVHRPARSKIDQLLGKEEFDLGFRVQMLAQALITQSKTYAQTGDRPNRPGGLRKLIEEPGKLDDFFACQKRDYINVLRLNHGPLDLKAFPAGSWYIELRFSLRKPYLSKDDREFYVLDNPVRKEWVFQVPYVAPSQWKGPLWAAMVQILKRWWEGIPKAERASKAGEFAERRFRLTLLFGDEKGEEPGGLKGLARYLDELGGGEAARIYRERVRKYFGAGNKFSLLHHQGHLHFYPTYFDQIGLEVINPHDRTTGAGKLPIYFECVPSGAQGVFRLLYVPLNGVDEQEMRKGFREVAEGLRAMFSEYGFGAKTSSGFGRARKESVEVLPKDLKKIWDEVWGTDNG